MATSRREQILAFLRQARGPVTGSDLARRFGVTRQVIVQDIALLRAGGEDILATPQGYRLGPGMAARPYRKVIAVQHSPAQTGDELYTLVEAGVRVLDVVVEHPIYGELRGLLLLETAQDVAAFLERVSRLGAALLSTLTGGVHLHTLEASHPGDIEKARARLREKGYLLDP